MRITTLVLAALLLPSTSDRTANQDPAQTATVHIVLLNSYGNSLGEKAEVIEFRDTTPGGHDFVHSFRQNTGTEVPFGTYRLRVRTAGFWTAEREVRVYQSEVWAVAALEFGMGTSEGGFPTSNVSGRIRGLESTKNPVRLRLSGIYSTAVMDTVMNPLGEFRFAGIPNGCYVIVTTREQEVLDVRSLCTPRERGGMLLIDLTKK